MSRRLILVPILLLFVLAGLTTYTAFDHVASLQRGQELVEHTHEVIETTQGLFSSVQDMETGQRGYLLTDDDAYLAPLLEARGQVAGQLARLRRLIADNPGQIDQVGALQQAVTRRVDIIDETLALMRAGRVEEARDLVRAGEGKVQMDRIRAYTREIIDRERFLLQDRHRQARVNEKRSLLLSLGVGGLALLGLALTILGMARGNQELAGALRERDVAEEGRREADALIRAVFENIPDYLYTFTVTPDGRFLVGDFNPALARLAGGQLDPLRGRDIMEAFPVLGPRLKALYERVLEAGAAITHRDTIEIPGAGPITWESMLAPVFDAEGRPVRIVGSSRDITEREKAEEQARRSQRMEAVGQLTGGVAHDFNNLLQVIRANLEMLERAVTDARSKTRLQNALRASDRAADLTRQLLAFARRQPLEPQAIDLGRLVGEMAELLRRTLGEGVEVETVLAGGLWNTLADRAQIESALLNLAINARDAMPEGGRLTVEVANVALDDRYAARDADLTPGQYVMLAVSDTGQGMSREVIARVFEPFFTTKAEGRGTGLGLSMVYGFVKQSKGHIQIYSEPGQGTTVKIYLPRTRQAEAQAAALDATIEGRGEMVLVVEDEAAVREAACAMLTDLGYGCLQADGPDSALEILRGEAAIDLLFTDVIMPGSMKTPAFVAEARRLRPGIAVVYTSGYTENAIVHHGRLDEGVTLLTKPYSKVDLARKISTTLNAERRTVLVVSDDAMVRAAAVEMVIDLGFAALEAGDGPAALALVEGGAKCDAVLTDVGLPGLRGDELARRLRGLRPDLRIVLASGSADRSVADGVDGAEVLDKPYDTASLARALGRPE